MVAVVIAKMAVVLTKMGGWGCGTTKMGWVGLIPHL